MQWTNDLIGYDALNSYGSPSYYAQKIFSLHKGDEVLAITAQDLPTRVAPRGTRRRRRGKSSRCSIPPPATAGAARLS